MFLFFPPPRSRLLSSPSCEHQGGLIYILRSSVLQIVVCICVVLPPFYKTLCSGAFSGAFSSRRHRPNLAAAGDPRNNACFFSLALMLLARHSFSDLRRLKYLTQPEREGQYGPPSFTGARHHSSSLVVDTARPRLRAVIDVVVVVWSSWKSCNVVGYPRLIFYFCMCDGRCYTTFPRFYPSPCSR